MNIQMSKETADHIIKDLKEDKGESIRFFARLGGSSSIQQGFSLGVIKDTPKHPAATLKLQDHLFFIEEEDEWFFDKNDLNVSIVNGEIQYEFSKGE
ncbi:HesB/YadR/YfhF family protein [Fictibacillus nanhaiensis]|uniref:HesB/YadR/YfhF family protein n=1 Tax=Fictibacillus nanhaiensis TaxID=742169 RepID=UPI001C961C66|nr:HesB/YadR/YfhF family protein [Fictibacillus nanhaiensis]MBY6035933.1 HesB/YadR/YfhF family protein [Fictibacillus nanhaiensis]